MEEKKNFFLKFTSGWTERIERQTRELNDLIARTNAMRMEYVSKFLLNLVQKLISRKK